MSSGTSSKRPERFHGAFTGGFSAGFFNSVGTAEGWTPSTFSSSRDKRAAPREQRPEDFMDDEDGLLSEQLQAKPAFDTLGSTAEEMAKKHAEREAAGGAIPGPAPSELILPVGDPMGKKLLRTMGWREGQGVGSRVRRKRRRFEAAEGEKLRQEDLPEQALAGLGKTARELIDKEGLTFAPKNADFKMQFVTAKTNLHGVGHEPFKDAPEFGAWRGARRGAVAVRGVYSTEDLVQKSSDEGLSRRPLAAAAALDRGSHGFVLDDGEDDVYDSGFGKEAYDEALDEATHDNLASSAKAWALGGAKGEDDPMLASRRYARCPSDGRLPPTGFVVAQRPDVQQKYWAPPIPPANFRPTPEFDENAASSLLQIPINQNHSGGPGLDASGRARLLGEPSRARMTMTNAPAAPPASLDQGKPPLAEGSSALSFLSPAARMKVLEAANGAAKALSRFSTPVAAASIPNASAGVDHSEGTGGASRQGGTSQPSGGLRFSLASKFTSERPVGAKADDAGVLQVAGVDPASRPAGLTLRSPAMSDSKISATASASEDKSSGAGVVQNPVRHTVDWVPSPLLCKRLNVPVPKASSAINWGGLQAGHGAAAATGEDLVGSLKKFVRGSSSSNESNSKPQMPLLKGMEERRPIVALPGSVSSAAAAAADDAPTERPPIDLFKSIFESESESDSDEDEESGGEGTATAAPKADAPAPAAPTKAPESVLEKPSLRRGYGTDSSDESSGPDQHSSVGHPLFSKKLEQDKTDSSSGRKRQRGENDSGTTRSDSSRNKHGHKHKKHKRGKKEKKERKYKKHRKHDSNRKRR